MKVIYRKRLQKLADFLKTVPRKQFDIERLVFGDPKKIGCGSIACAIGHCPIVFPKQWKFIGSYYVKLRSGGIFWDLDSEKFFGIAERDVVSIFTSQGYQPYQNVTPKMVARKIEKFLKENAG